jgi:proteasome lid subunit RPN8/RPN11
MTMHLQRSLVNHLLQQAQAHPDTEICGLVSQLQGRTRLYTVDNVASDPGRLFEMDPQQQIEAMRNMRESGEQLFAIYHSHPHGPASPSAEDLQRAAYPEALYLIISLATTGVLEMRGYRLYDQSLVEEELVMES